MNWMQNVDFETINNSFKIPLNRKHLWEEHLKIGLPSAKNEHWKYSNLSKHIDQDWQMVLGTETSTPKLSKINPLVFKALDDVMSIYNIPALLYAFGL